MSSVETFSHFLTRFHQTDQQNFRIFLLSPLVVCRLADRESSAFLSRLRAQFPVCVGASYPWKGEVDNFLSKPTAPNNEKIEYTSDKQDE